MQEIGMRIRQARKNAGLTQEELGKAIGHGSGSLVGAWECGERNPKITSLMKIADTLGIALNELHPQQMTPNSYQREALRTASGMTDTYPMALNGVLGLAGESGECVDMMKKHLFQGHPLDREQMAKELGDVAWYLAVTAHAIGYDLETVLAMNVEKLRKRYPDGFEAERSLHRAEGDT